MGKDLSNEVEKVHVAEIVNHGEKIILPEQMTMLDAIDVLKRRQKYEEEPVNMSRVYPFLPQDGAYALSNAISKRYGWVPQEATMSFFGSNPPSLITVKNGVNTTVQVPWGNISLPQVEGTISTRVAMENGMVCFKLQVEVRRKHSKTIEWLFEEIENELKTNSLFMGKAIKMRFTDNDGDTLEFPEPEFIDLSGISRGSLIYSKSVERLIEMNLFTPIDRIQDCIDNHIPVKRGVLLGGPYGTGKTLAATVAASLAVAKGITYIYVPRAAELHMAIQFAKNYASTAAIVFCEDIDRVIHGERSVQMDDILNILDGIDTKRSNIITVLTTNHLENINPAMLRPGRLDAVIEVTAPDEEACERLIRYYAGKTLSIDEDVSAAAQQLKGTIPAVIAEVVKRAKIYQLHLQPAGEKLTQISGEAVYQAALTIAEQVRLLEEQSKPKELPITLDTVFRSLLSESAGSNIKNIKSSIAGELKKAASR